MTVCAWADRARASWKQRVRLGSEEGQSTVEYSLIVAMISVPLFLIMWQLVKLLLSEVIRILVQEFTTGP